MKLLFNIAFYYNETDKCESCKFYTNNVFFPADFRLMCFIRTLQTILLYEWETTIYIDTNSSKLKEKLFSLGIVTSNIHIVVHDNLSHNYFLTCMHRKRMMDNIDLFDYFFYSEDDMVIPFSKLKLYYDRMDNLWPTHAASFARFEPLDEHTKISVDAVSVSKRLLSQIVHKNGKKYINLDNCYSACWGLSQKQLKEVLDAKDFLIEEFSQNVRESAASFPTIQLQKLGMIELDNENKIQETSCIEHGGRRYLTYKNPPFGTIPMNNLFEFN